MLPEVLPLEQVAHSAQRVWCIAQGLPSQRDVGGLVLQTQGSTIMVWLTSRSTCGSALAQQLITSTIGWLFKQANSIKRAGACLRQDGVAVVQHSRAPAVGQRGGIHLQVSSSQQ